MGLAGAVFSRLSLSLNLFCGYWAYGAIDKLCIPIILRYFNFLNLPSGHLKGPYKRVFYKRTIYLGNKKNKLKRQSMKHLLNKTKLNKIR